MNNHSRTDKKAGKGGVLSRFLALEPRVLLDAAAVETASMVADAASESLAPDTADSIDALSAAFGGNIQNSNLSAANGASEILFVDAGVDDYASLITGLGSNVEVHVLDGTDWAGQIQAVLGRRDGDVGAIHIVSHGEAGVLELGNDNISAANVANYSRVWSAMNQALASGGDLLIYGCDVGAGESGQALVRALSDYTGADVAASDDRSGVATLGGDWDLEVKHGQVETAALYSQESTDFMGLLVDSWVQDTEISVGTSAVGITRTYDATNGYRDWKFIGTSGSNRVEVYLRDPATGAWAKFGGNLTGDGSGLFGYDIAAAGNRLVVSAPEYNNGTKDGRIYIYNWNGTNWTTGIQTIGSRDAVNSGDDGDGGGDGADDRFGFSVDMAWNGNYTTPEYRMIVGQPHEDWWNSEWYDWSLNERPDAGVAFVYSATTGNFAYSHEFVSMVNGGTTGANDRFGDAVAATYDASKSTWWYAVGSTGRDFVRLYSGTSTTVVNSFAWDSGGPNDISMDDDYMVIARSADVQAYKLNAAGTSWGAIGSAFGAGGAVVSIDDTDQSAAGDSVYGNARLIYSGTISGSAYTYIAVLNSAGQFQGSELINTRQEVAVALDRFRSLDAVMANGTNAQSWHYNWEPDVVADALLTNEDSSTASVNVISNDADINRDSYGIFGDVLTVSAVGSSAYGATVTFSGGTVTYNASSSSYLQTLARGQTAEDLITVTVTDGQGGYATSVLTVTIEGRNDVPVATGVVPLVPLRVQQSGTTAVYDLSAYFNDIDQGEAGFLTPVISSFPPGWTVVADGALLLVTIPSSATHGSVGQFTVSFKDPNMDLNGDGDTNDADEAGLTSSSRNFSIQVDAVNDAPVLKNAILDQVALAQYGFNFQVPANTFFDADPSPFDVLTYTATLAGGGALPSWLSFDAATRTFSGIPAAGDVGAITVRVTANDGTASVYDDFALTIVNPSVHTAGQFTDGPSANADFGFSIAISGNGSWMVVGSPGYTSNQGAVFYYENVSGSWTYRGSVAASDGATGDKFGYSVAISDDGTKLIVGARGDDGGAGSAYCYTRSGSTFGTQAKMVAATRVAEDFFGTSVAINESGTHVLIGASHYDVSGVVDAGAAFMAAFGNTTPLAGFIAAKDASAYDRFGTSVAFDQNILVVSSMADDNPSGMVSRIGFDDGDGINASANFGSVSATLQNGSQFYYDAARGQVLKLEGSDGRALLNTAIDLGASWSISAWYDMGGLGSATYRTLTRGGDYSETQQLIVTSTGANNVGTFTLTLPGTTPITTAAISWHTDDQILAARIQAALIAAGASTSATVSLVDADTYAITFAQTGNKSQLTANTAGLTAGAATISTLSEGVIGNHQIIINAGTNNLGVWNNSTSGTAGFNAALTFEEQVLTVGTGTGNFTLTLSPGGTTASITYSNNAITMATRIQAALNTLLGSTTATTVAATSDGASDTFRVVFNTTIDRAVMTSSRADVTAAAGINGGQIYTLTGSGWHNITAVGEGTTTTFYLDGVRVAMAAFKPTDDVIAVGNYQTGGQRFADYIDDFRVYDRALTASEIRNVYQGVANTDAAYGDAGGVYVFSTDLTNSWQVAKLYAPDGFAGDMLGWAIDVDIFDVGGVRQSGIIVASSIYNDSVANEGGAVYVWRSSSLQSGALNNGGAGYGTWQLETKITTFDANVNTYFGNDVAVDYDEATGGTRLVVAAPFEDTNGAYSGAVYGYKYQSGVWLPEKFVDASPQGGSIATAAFFGNAVDVAGTRAVFGSRWRDTGGQINDGAAYGVELLTQGSYATVMSVEAMTGSLLALSDEASLAAFALDTSSTQGTVSYSESGKLVYSAGDAFSTLSVGETATDSFTYFTEQGGITYANLVVVTVYGAEAPVPVSSAQNDVVRVSADQVSVLDVLANDISGSGELTLLSVQAVGLQGQLLLSGGVLSYNPQGQFDALRAGESAQQTFSYVAVDADGNEITGQVTLVIDGVDDVLHAGADNATVAADGSIVIDVLANDSDKDGQSTFWVSYFDTTAAQGQVVYNGDGTFSYTPGEAFAGLPLGQTAVDRVVYTIRDSSGHEYSALLSITVTGVYEGEASPENPVSGNDVAVTSGMSPVIIPVAENDTAGQVVSVAASAYGEVTILEDGSLRYTPGSSLSMLAAGTVYVDAFSYTVRHADGSTTTATVRVYVNGDFVTSRLAAEEEDKAYFASLPVSAASMESAAFVMSAAATATEPSAPEVSVGEMALQALLETTAADDVLALPADTTEADVLSAGDATDAAILNAPVGKPTLLAMLERERAVRQPDLSALLRSLA